MYFQLIRNKISLICFATTLFIKVTYSGASLLRAFKSRFLSCKVKIIEIFTDDTPRVLISV